MRSLICCGQSAARCLLSILIVTAMLASAQDLPPPPFWHFSVVTANNVAVQIIFPKVPGVPEAAFVVQRSATLDFANPTTLPNQYFDSGLSYAAGDQPSNWPQGKTPYYRVGILDQSGKFATTSSPAQPLLQSGNLFVVQGVPSVPGIPCGELATLPCNNIQTAVNSAPAGATVYVAPGSYFGPGNVNINFGGKAITLASAAGAKVTALNGTDPATGNKTNLLQFFNGETRNTVVSGFTFTGGDSPTGGCIFIEGATPTIQDSFFYRCVSTTGVARGGAIYVKGAPAPGPLIQRSAFVYNEAQEGAGVYVESALAEVKFCSFEWSLCLGGTGRGGAILAQLSEVRVTNVSMKTGIVGFGGGAMTAERSRVYFENVEAYNNTCGNFGGAFLLFGAEMYVKNSNFTGNYGNIFGGAVVSTSSIYEANDTIHNDNFGRIGGGGVKVVGGTATLRRCQVNGNTGGYGAAFDIADQSDYASMETNVLVEDTEVMNNIVTDKGGAFLLDSFDSVIFRNTRFGGNIAVRGGAGWCSNAKAPALFEKCSFEYNTASMGGGFFIDSPCRVTIKDSMFKANTAVEYGAGMVVGDGSEVNITGSRFEGNGLSACQTFRPPKAGGALLIGVEQFKTDDQTCSANKTDVITAKVMVSNSIFVGNLAMSKGGGVLLEAGSLTLNTVQIADNYVIGDLETDGEGLGGGLAVMERCDLDEDSPDGFIPGSCTIATATMVNSAVSGNSAKSAGGGVYYSGGSTKGWLTIKNSVVGGNKASNDQHQDSVGGGMYIGRDRFAVTDLLMQSNNAFYGGAMFFSVDFAKNTTVARIKSTNNTAVLGSSVYWLRSASPQADFDYTTMLIDPIQPSSIATEVLSTNYSVVPPRIVQSAVDVETFTVDMVDYYGNPGVAESGGACIVAPDETVAADSEDGNATDATVRSEGAESAVSKGTAVFSQVFVTGSIGADYGLKVTCTPNSLGRSRFLQLKGQPLPALPMSISISQCIAGSEPIDTSGGGEICGKCGYNTFNFDGKECLPCPDGATCAGGDEIASLENYWRSATNSTDFYACRNPNICLAGPEAGDEACNDGQQGPLCAVCQKDYFQFGGRCRSCDDGGQATAMLVFTVLLIIVMIIVIFGLDWQFGKPGQPGVMAKAKIFIAHLQILAVLREYDVSWPKVTSEGLGWFEAVNIGFSMLAPGCFIGESYSFWWVWNFQMALPIVAVVGCVAAYYAAHFTLKAKDPEGTLQASDEPPKFIVWLMKLKVRCWKNAFWLVTLLYPRCSMTALQMFSTQKLNIGTFLTADYDIMVRPPGGDFTDTYVRYMIPGGFMLAIIAFGIPFFWFMLIWKNRMRLDEELVAKKYGFLYGDYSRAVPYWETAEMLRKFLVSFIPVFVPVQPEGSLQGTIGQILFLFYLVMVIYLRPFAHAEDNGLQASSLTVLWLVLLAGCTAKWAELSPGGEKALAIFELFLSSAVGFVAIALIIMHFSRKRKNKSQEEDATTEETTTTTKPSESKPAQNGTKKWGLPIAVRAGGSTAAAKPINVATDRGTETNWMVEDPIARDALNGRY